MNLPRKIFISYIHTLRTADTSDTKNWLCFVYFFVHLFQNWVSLSQALNSRYPPTSASLMTELKTCPTRPDTAALLLKMGAGYDGIHHSTIGDRGRPNSWELEASLVQDTQSYIKASVVVQ